MRYPKPGECIEAAGGLHAMYKRNLDLLRSANPEAWRKLKALEPGQVPAPPPITDPKVTSITEHKRLPIVRDRARLSRLTE